jgi:hypothetical protein
MEGTLQILDDKMGSSAGTTYEALQYLQSFIARKSKSLGKDGTSDCVFHGATILMNRTAYDDAGTLLEWFIDSDDFNTLDKDLDRLLDFLKKYQPNQTEPVVQRINGPIHQKVFTTASTSTSTSTSLREKLRKLDASFADIFENTCKWHNAYKTVIRLGDTDRGAKILDSWSKEGYKYEKPLFFARAVLTFLSENKVNQANNMVRACSTYMKDIDNISTTTNDPRPGDEDSCYVAVYHLSIILSELAKLPPMERVDKTRLFNVLFNLYAETIVKLDPKLLELIQRVGIVVFQMRSTAAAGPNPMAMLQGLMQAGAPKLEKGKKSHAPGTIGGMNPQDILGMIDAMKHR